MPFSHPKFDALRANIEAQLRYGSLRRADRIFLGEMLGRLRHHGSDTNFTDAEFQRILRVSGSVGGRVHQPQEDTLARSSSSDRSSKFRRNWWWHAIGLVIFPAFAVWIVLQLAERFPEYMGPLPALTSVQTISGPVVHVRDGETFVVAAIPVKLGSLDCPEKGTVAGERAAKRMQSLIAHQVLTCALNGRSTYGRMIGSCITSDGRDVAAVMIKEGVCRRYW